MSAIDVLSETELEVRDARPDDVHAIAAIYAACASRARVI